MSARTLFRFVWRVNAVLILVAGVLALWSIGFGFRCHERERKQPRPGIADVLKRKAKVAPVELGEFESIEGAAVVRAALTSEMDDGMTFSRHARVVARNYLYVDPATLESRWLLPSNDQAIVVTDDIRFPDRCDECGVSAGSVRATAFLVAERDANGDGDLDDADGLTLFIGAPGGQPLTAVAHNVTAYHGRRALTRDAVVLFFAEAGTLKAAKVDLDRWAVHEEKRLLSN